MKRAFGIALLAALCLALLAGCAEAPAQAADGAAWSEDWVTLGDVLGVGPCPDGLTLQDNNTALSATDMYYAFWTAGEPGSYLNEDGDEVELYEVRLDLLVCGCKDGAAARETVGEWQNRLQKTYAVSGSQTETRNGQEYCVAAYTCGSQTNPYSRGVSAFAVYGSYAVSAELNCLESSAADEAAVLARFLDSCHYNAALAE